MKIIDTHCHLNFNSFDQDLETVIERARENNVGKIIIPGTDITTSKTAINICEKYVDIYAAVGMHPNDANAWDKSSISMLKELAHHPSVVAIGEIGLDYYRDHSPHDLQHQVFSEQLLLAAEMNLPVVVHSRNSFSDVWRILKAWLIDLETNNKSLYNHPGVLHAFESSREDALIAISNNFFIGIGGPVTYHNAEERKNLVEIIPLENILLETDSPFLTPHPLRGSRNEPSYIRFIAEKVAQLKDMALSEVVTQTENNAAKLFFWRAE